MSSFDWVALVFLIGLPALLLGVIVHTWVRNRAKAKKNKEQAVQFLQSCPDAARVMLLFHRSTGEEIIALSVDGQPPLQCIEKGARGFYLTAGSHIVELVYTYYHRNQVRRSNPVKITVNAKAKHIYRVGYERNMEQFILEDIT